MQTFRYSEGKINNLELIGKGNDFLNATLIAKTLKTTEKSNPINIFCIAKDTKVSEYRESIKL